MFEGGTRVPGVIVWPNITAAGSRSDAIIQSEDYYPTLLAGLNLKPAEGQRFDGSSILPALKGDALADKAVFQYFPHSPGVPDWLPPAVSVHRGDWKLIRIFHGGDKGAHRHLLFNLRDDLGEKNNLAGIEPQRVQAMDSLIEQFLTETKAVVPVLNPAFNPAAYQPETEGRQKAKAKAAAKEKAKANPKATASPADDAALQGWKARGCTATVKDGIVTVTGKGSEPFLGFAAGKLVGQTVMRFRSRTATGGKGKVEWLPTPQASEKAQSIAFQLSAGDWQEITVELPAEGALGIVRLYLPAQTERVQIDWVELLSGNDTRRSDF
jgi:hypothetical protein